MQGILQNGKWLMVDGKLAISSACCCEPSGYACLPFIPPVLYVVIAGATPLNGTYTLAWNAAMKRWEYLLESSGPPGPVEDILITINVLDCDASPVSPDPDMSAVMCESLPEGGCLIFSMRCATFHFVNAPTPVVDQTSTPHVTGSVPAYGTNGCVFPGGGPYPDVSVIIVDDLSLV
jgi:hypothetical protein